MAEEAADVLGAQSVVEDGAADRLLQDAQQDQLLVDLKGEITGKEEGIKVRGGGAHAWRRGLKCKEEEQKI